MNRIKKRTKANTFNEIFNKCFDSISRRDLTVLKGLLDHPNGDIMQIAILPVSVEQDDIEINKYILSKFDFSEL